MLGRRKLIAAAALLATAAIAILASQGPRGAGPEAAPAGAPAAKTAAPDRAAIPAAEEGLASAPTPGSRSGEDDPLPALNGPSEDEVAREAADDPHVTPAALIDFSHQIAGLMIEARKNEKLAGEAFAKLEECASDEAGKQVVQVRMVCLANAHQIANHYPALQARYQALARKSADIASLAASTGIDD